MYQNSWFIGIMLLHISVNSLIVRQITEIYYKIVYITESGSSISQQSIYILKKSLCLSYDIPNVYHMSMTVDACCPRNEIFPLVVSFQHGASLERYAILMCRIQMVKSF